MKKKFRWVILINIIKYLIKMKTIIKRLEYQFIKCPDLNVAQDGVDIIKNKLENERNLYTLGIINKKELNSDIDDYYISILTNEYQLKEIKDLLKKYLFIYQWN